MHFLLTKIQIFLDFCFLVRRQAVIRYRILSAEETIRFKGDNGISYYCFGCTVHKPAEELLLASSIASFPDKCSIENSIIEGIVAAGGNACGTAV